MGNPKLRETIFDVEGGQQLLTFMGFQLNMPNPDAEQQQAEESNAEDTYAILPMDASLDMAREVYLSLQEKGYKVGPPPATAPTTTATDVEDGATATTLMEQASRHFTLFSPPQDSAPVGVPDVPDDFYELTPNEAKLFLTVSMPFS